MRELAAGKVRIQVRDSSNELAIDWIGESDSTNPADVLSSVFEELKTLVSGRTVRMSFKELSYMNSSSVTPIMAFLRELNDAAQSVHVSYRQDLQWQATSFRAMRVVARKWSNVEVIGE